MEDTVVPLNYSEIGKEKTIVSVGGKPKVRAFLGELGIVPGGKVTVVASMGGSIIVKVKESRIAVSREMAARILV